MVGESGRGLSSARMTLVLVAVVGRLGVFRERAGEPCRGRGTADVAGGKSECRECAEWNDAAGLAGGWGADGRAVVTGCDEPLARGGGAVERVGPVWLMQIGLAGGPFEMRRLAVGGLAGRGRCHGVVTCGAKHGGTE